MGRIQLIEEKKMTSKLLKQFTVRTFIYSLLYFCTIVAFFIFQPLVKSEIWTILLITGIDVLYLMLLSRLATIEAFEGINTTSAPKKSLDRIASVVSIPMFIFTGISSFIDVIFLHSVFDTSNGYTRENMLIFVGMVLINLTIWSLVVNVYEKRILRRYLTIEEENAVQEK